MSTCFSAVQACRMRLTRTDNCGKVVPGEKNVITTKGFISLTAAAEISAGASVEQKNGCGEVCLQYKSCDTFLRYNLSLALCGVDPEALEMLTGTRLLTDPNTGEARGFTNGEGKACEGGVSIELWQRTLSDCGEGELFLYWAFPLVDSGSAQLGDLTFEDGPLNFTVTAQTKPVGVDTWGPKNRGPHLVLPEGAGLLKGEHVASYLSDIPMPDPVCGATAYVEPAEIFDAATAFEVQDRDVEVNAAITPIDLDYRNAEGLTSPATFEADGLPEGLTIAPATGVISGTPTEEGTFVVKVKATGTNAPNAVASDNFVIKVVPVGTARMDLTNPGNQTSTIDTPITALQLAATGTPVTPVTYGAVNLPDGLTLNTATGEITGTPTEAGAFAVVVTATGGNGTTDDETFTWTIA